MSLPDFPQSRDVSKLSFPSGGQKAFPAGSLGELAGQGMRFAAVGVAATSVHFLTVVLIVDVLGLPNATLATFAGCVLGILTSYAGNHRWTFKARRRHLYYFSRFLTAYASVMLLHTGLMYVMEHLLGLHYVIPFAAATGVSTVVNFLLNRYVVFADKRRRPRESASPLE